MIPSKNLPPLRQAGRLIEFHSCLGDDLVALEFEGDEILGQAYTFEFRCLSYRQNIQPDELLGTRATVVLNVGHQGPRFFHGIIQAFGQVFIDYEDRAYYDLDLVPEYALLQFHMGRGAFFQFDAPKTALVHAAQAKVHVDLSALTQTYPKRAYRLQYNENSYDFLQRLLADEGITYYVVNTAAEHYVALCDHTPAFRRFHPPLRYSPTQPAGPCLYAWSRHSRAQPRGLRLRCAKPGAPNHVLDVTAWNPNATPMTGLKLPPTCLDGEYFADEKSGLTLAKRRLQAQVCQAERVYAASTAAHLHIGCQFQHLAHTCPEEEGTYVPIRITHVAKDNAIVFGESHPDALHEYHNRLVAIPSAVPFVPQPLPKPLLPSLVTAKVQGPQDQAIHTDNQGRVKVQFPWEVELSERSDSKACWLRPVSLMTGESVGTQHIPRVGTEVRVSHEHGDIDRPMLVDAVYHSDTPPPLALPEDAATSMLHTPYHRIDFNDTPGHEALSVHSQGSAQTEVGQDYEETIGADRQLTVGQDMITHILQGGGNLVAQEIHLIVGHSQVVLNDDGVTLCSQHLYLEGQDVDDAYPIARIGDDHACHRLDDGTPHQGGPLLTGSPSVTIDGIPVTRVGDIAHCLGHTDVLKTGADSITVDGQPIAHVRSGTEHGGLVISGSPHATVRNKQPISTLPSPSTQDANSQSLQYTHWPNVSRDG